MKKKIIITGITCAFLLISGICYSFVYRQNSVDTDLITTLTDATITTGAISTSPSPSFLPDEKQVTINKNLQETSSIYVHLVGAVKEPGVYEVTTATRLYELVKLAGGLTGEAAGDYVNQAITLGDGQRIYIPTLEEVAKLSQNQRMEGDKTLENGNNSDTQNQTVLQTDRININTASLDQLMTLPGIGQAKADSIINYRTQNGLFTKIEELMNISGIKEGLFGKVKEYISVE